MPKNTGPGSKPGGAVGDRAHEWAPVADRGVVDRLAGARSTGAKLALGLAAARREKRLRTTTPVKDDRRAGDLLGRDLTAPAANRTCGVGLHLLQDLGRVGLGRVHRRHRRPEGRGLTHPHEQGGGHGGHRAVHRALATRPRETSRRRRAAQVSGRRTKPSPPEAPSRFGS